MIYSALIGNPVEHSISNHLFHNLAELTGLEYGHLKIAIPSQERIGIALENMQNLGFCGCNITLPYKVITRQYLDHEDQSVSKTGAVNTIVFSDRGMEGFNTDVIGASRSLEEQLAIPHASDTVIVFGAGGAARSVFSTLGNLTRNIFVVNRTIKHGDALCAEFGLRGTVSIDSIHDILALIQEHKPRFFINTTPLGMFPKHNLSPMSDELLSLVDKCGINFASCFFLDAVFNPATTCFVDEARKRGARAINGLPWMIYQALAAFKIWTGREIHLSQTQVVDLTRFLAAKMRAQA